METADRIRLFDMTHAQKRVWYIEQINPGIPLHNLSLLSRIKGRIHKDYFERAILCFIANHAAIRFRIVEDDGGPKQYEEPFIPFQVPFLDLSLSPDAESELMDWTKREASTPIPLGEGPLYRFAIIRISGNEYALWAKLHHIIADGWSFQIIVDQVYNEYERLIETELSGYAEGEAPGHPGPRYYDYIEQEQSYISSERFNKDREFWLQQFAVLPEERVHSSIHMAGNRKSLQLDRGLTSRIRDWVQEHKLSINTLFTAAFAIYTYKKDRCTDIVLGTPVSNHTTKFKQAFGMMTSTMPIRIDFDDERGELINYIRLVDRKLQKCYKSQKYPYDLLVHDLQLKKHEIEHLFPVSVNYYNFQLGREIDGLTTVPLEVYSGSQLFPLQLVIRDWDPEAGLQLDFDYKTDDYSEQQIERIFLCLTQVLETILDHAELPLDQLDLLSPSLKHKLLYDWNETAADYPRHQSVIQLFEQQVRLTPEQIACEWDGMTVTYDQLNRRSNQLAHYLRHQSVGQGNLVGIMMTHSIEMIISILAVLKAGAAYVPVDPDYPADRIQYMLETSNAVLMLVHAHTASKRDFNCPSIDISRPNVYEFEPAFNLDLSYSPQDLAYVIFTSGSTGKPKGVMIEHQGLTNYIWWAKNTYIHRPSNEIFACYSSIAFDLTVTSIFTPLISGNRILLYSDDGGEYVLYRIWRDNRATMVKLTPAHLMLMNASAIPNSSIHTLIVGGEDLKTELCSRIQLQFGREVHIYNEYGPTETVVGCMVYRFDRLQDRGTSVPIGVPAANVQIYVLDPQLQPVPYGSVGEMYISGDGVARGYMNRDDLTAERFLSNPFVPGTRMYKSGDLAKLSDDGQLLYIGRSDQQVKIRGYRIELSEIENEILANPDVREAVVIDRTDENGSRYLCAYFVGYTPIAIEELRDSLLAVLPPYMIPSQFVELDAIPLTVNGKVDRSRLPDPKETNTPCADMPRNAEEAALLRCVQEVLGNDQIGIAHNVYHYGGDSIKAIQIASRLLMQGYKLKVKDMLAHPVISDMARKIERTSLVENNRGPRQGKILATPITSWFFEQQFRMAHYYNQSFLLTMKRPIEPAALNGLLIRLVQHHDGLRINVDSGTNELFYNEEHRQTANVLEVADLSRMNGAEKRHAILERSMACKSTMDLSRDLLFRALLFRMGDEPDRLLLTAHHLVIDGVSWRILMDDLTELLVQHDGTNKTEDLVMPQASSSYQDWAVQLNAIADSTSRTGGPFADCDYWQTKQFDTIPADNPEGSNEMTYVRRLEVFLPETETSLLCAEANVPYHTKPNELLIAALTGAITHWKRIDKLSLMMEGHGREEMEGYDWNRTVGWFTSLYPVQLSFGEEGLAERIKSVKEQLRSVPDNGMAYGLHRQLTGKLKQDDRRFIRFNYLGELDQAMETEWFGVAAEDHGLDVGAGNHMTCLIDINAYVIQGRLSVRIEFSMQQLSEGSMHQLADRFMEQLRQVVDHCVQSDQMAFTPSDFETLNISQDDLDQLFE